MHFAFMKEVAQWKAWWSLFTKYYSSDQIKKNEIGRACVTDGGEERWLQVNLRERDQCKTSA